MSEQVRVELSPVSFPDADANLRVVEAAKRLNAAYAAGSAEEIAEAESAVAAARASSTVWRARIAGAEFPVADYAVQQDDGRVIVSLMVEASSLQIGAPSTGAEQPQVRPAAPPKNEAPANVWGAPGKPDPRANIPGWTPEAAQ